MLRNTQGSISIYQKEIDAIEVHEVEFNAL